MGKELCTDKSVLYVYLLLYAKYQGYIFVLNKISALAYVFYI